jgi:hypothetical protein
LAIAAAAVPDPSGQDDPAQLQAKTNAANANFSRRLRKELGTKERERRAAKNAGAQP